MPKRSTPKTASTSRKKTTSRTKTNRKVTPARVPAQGIIQGNTSRDHLFRIFTIFSELQNGRRTKLSELAEHCGCHERTIQRDINTMQTLLDIGITSTKVNRIVGEELFAGKDKQYTMDPSQRHFPIVRIGEEDLLTIHFLRQCLEPYKDTSIGKSMLESFKRSFGVLTGTTDWKKWARIIHFSFEGRPEVAKEDVNYFEVLHKAILQNHKVSFVYRSTNAPQKGERQNQGDHKEFRIRILQPNFLFMRNGSWYLHALDPDEQKEKIFKFARIRKLKMVEEKFQPRPRYPNTADYFKYSYAIIPASEKPKENVVLEFTEKSVRRVKETLWHPEQKLTKLDEERVRLELPFAEATYMELRPWILSWGANVKVIGPKKLKDAVAADIRSMAVALG